MTILAVSVVAAFPVFAQQNDGPSDTPGLHPFAFGSSGGDPATPDTEVYDLRIPIAFTVIPTTEDGWGLRVRLIAYAGVYDFTPDETIDLDLKFRSFAATPGVEFLIPLGEFWTLKPFAEVGYGRDFDNALDYGVWSVGMRTIATWPVKEWGLSFGTKLQYLSTFTSDIAFADDYGEVRFGFDARHPLPFGIGGSRADLSGYAIRRQYIDALIEREEDGPLEIRFSNEIGFTIGTTPKTKLWFVSLPRIGLGYRWGPNIRGVRLNFGFPF